jgi:hypothetical protein
MTKSKTKIQIVGIVLLPLLLSGCFLVKIKRDVDDPSPYFRKAHSQLERIHQKDPYREGSPRRMHILVYNDSSQELIRITTAIWFMNWCLDLGAKHAEWNGEFDEGFEFDWRAIKDFRQLGPGLLVEVEAEQEKVLIWL